MSKLRSGINNMPTSWQIYNERLRRRHYRKCKRCGAWVSKGLMARLMHAWTCLQQMRGIR